MKKKNVRATIRDVADLVGVHHSTVSRALSPEKNSQISPAMVKKVKAAADKLGYYPNIVASSLKQNRSYALGVLIPDLMNPVFPPIIRGIQDTAESYGYSIITANTDDDKVRELSALRMMQGRSIEGIVVATAQRSDTIVDECVKNNIPVVLVNRTVDVMDGESSVVDAVISDEEFGIRSALDHLIGLGHKQIAHIEGPQHTSTGYARAQEFARYMKTHKLDASLTVAVNKYAVEDGYAAFRKLLAKEANFTAILASNDLIALGCIDAIREMGRRVPEDVSVVGHNDIPFLDRMEPALTTVSIAKYEMGVTAVKMLFENIKGERDEPQTVELQPRLIVRKSTSAPNK